QKGAVGGAAFFGMAVSMLIGGFICDLLGMKRIMYLAFTCHLIGTAGTIFAPPGHFSFTWLLLSSFIVGCGHGMVETGINPLAATLFPTRKTHYLNILHAWWPGGLILGGLAASFVGKGIDLSFVYIPGLELDWQIKLCLILFPCLLYGAML